MKTSELIRQLQEVDPSGELECCVGGVDIYFVAQEPGHYDGSYEVLIRDEKKAPYYDVVGAKVTKKGSKVQFHLHSIEDMLVDNPEMPVEFECCNDEACHHRALVGQWRAEARQINEEVEREMAARKPNQVGAVTLARVAIPVEQDEEKLTLGERIVVGLANAILKVSGR